MKHCILGCMKIILVIRVSTIVTSQIDSKCLLTVAVGLSCSCIRSISEKLKIIMIFETQASSNRLTSISKFKKVKDFCSLKNMS